MKTPTKPLLKIPIIFALALIIGLCIGGVLFIRCNPFNKPSLPKAAIKSKTKPDVKAATNAETPVKKEKIATTAINKTKYSTTDPSSVWVVVNKQHILNPADFTPSDLTTYSGATISTKAIDDFKTMLDAANNNAITLSVVSSYRSYATQTSLYNGYVANNGQAAADTFSARPGYSEHQTGFAVDFGSVTNSSCNFDDCYANTAEGAWLAAHAYEYGFLLRYTTDKQSITGYKNEPWHYRYIGRELAAEMKKQSITTLEEFFAISGGTSY